MRHRGPGSRPTSLRLSTASSLAAWLGSISLGALPAAADDVYLHNGSVFEDVVAEDGPWRERVRGLRANASTLSHAELDEATELDDGDPDDLGARYAALREQLPALSVLGGCCGTDHRHVTCIRDAWLA